jgi:hypothetical protein
MGLYEPARTVHPAGLFVGYRYDDDFTTWSDPRARQLDGRYRVHHRDALHVESAAAPHISSVDLATERIVRPVFLFDRDDVGVRQKDQGGSIGGPRHARGDAGATLRRLQGGDLETTGTQLGRQDVGRELLVTRGVDGSRAQELLEHLEGLHGTSLRLGSRAP